LNSNGSVRIVGHIIKAGINNYIVHYIKSYLELKKTSKLLNGALKYEHSYDGNERVKEDSFKALSENSDINRQNIKMVNSKIVQGFFSSLILRGHF